MLDCMYVKLFGWEGELLDTGTQKSIIYLKYLKSICHFLISLHSLHFFTIFHFPFAYLPFSIFLISLPFAISSFLSSFLYTAADYLLFNPLFHPLLDFINLPLI